MSTSNQNQGLYSHRQYHTHPTSTRTANSSKSTNSNTRSATIIEEWRSTRLLQSIYLRRMERAYQQNMKSGFTFTSATSHASYFLSHHKFIRINRCQHMLCYHYWKSEGVPGYYDPYTCEEWRGSVNEMRFRVLKDHWETIFGHVRYLFCLLIFLPKLNIIIICSARYRDRSDKFRERACSCSLYVYGECIIREALENWSGEISIGERKISNLRYADDHDTLLIAADEEEMAELIVRVKAVSERFGFRIDWGKTKVMIVDRAESLPNSTVLGEYEKVNTFI